MLEADLKRSNVTEFHMSIGTSFQTIGAAWLNVQQAIIVLVSSDGNRSKLDKRNTGSARGQLTDETSTQGSLPYPYPTTCTFVMCEKKT